MGYDIQASQCNMMQLTKKCINTIQASCTLEGTVFENVESIKYPGNKLEGDWGKIVALGAEISP